MKDANNQEISGSNAQSLELIELALHQFRCLADDPLATADAALAASPELVMGHILRAWLHLLSTEAPAVAIARDAATTARSLPRNERETLHLRAIEQLCAGRWRAAGRTLEDLSIAYPHDSLALQAGQQIDFFTGDTRMLRDRLARAMLHWTPDRSGYHAVLGMYAFGLEENGDYANAERLGRTAVELQPRDSWAQHAVAHVMEMQGRREEGIRWMRDNAGWQRDSFLAVHNWWHLALYHLELGDYDEVLRLFDGPIDGHGSLLHMELLDACALLWRLQLRGVDVGDRWHSLAERWAPSATSSHYAFNDLHAALAFTCAGREELLEELLAAQIAAERREDDNALFTREVGTPATRALVAFQAGDYARCVRLLRPIRSHAHRFGGSHAQRDLLDQTLIAAARRSGETALAQALESERRLLAEQRSAVA
ncbi:tetratricopeptide repeat protein [Pseudomonas schmalbachii]|uniref:Tetratricopeptide repeat protein 38 n=1 Tax=Pseudomonas schmalbachii TaxID=2816993 RepID=A0ABS3TP46_9PSED|nr:tetratricopeptide repeat protein [Pseudomonas schmalbachii]MBO3275441.1 tetratricopeptide repeat protein [Pseudomonas schmalbachii]